MKIALLTLFLVSSLQAGSAGASLPLPKAAKKSLPEQPLLLEDGLITFEDSDAPSTEAAPPSEEIDFLEEIVR